MAMFPRTAAQFSELGSNFKNLGGNVSGSFTALKDSVSGGTGKLGGMVDWVSKSTVQIARQPVKFVSWTYKTFPVLSAIVTIGGGAMVVGSYFRNRAEKRTEREFAAQAAAMPQGPAVQTNNYQITPAEYAEMQARMRDSMGQGSATGHAERFLAAKQAASAMPPEAAKPTADLAQL